MINSVQLKNFGPLVELDWQNLGQINLVIGNNGCGKSFLLKALYTAMRTLEDYKRGDNPDSAAEILADKLYWTFQAEKIGDLVTRKSNEDLSFNLVFNQQNFSYSFDKTVINAISDLNNKIPARDDNSIYLPAKEVLSILHIILDSRDHSKWFGFDDTYLDLAKALRRHYAEKISMEDSIKNISNLIVEELNAKSIKEFQSWLSNAIDEIKENIKSKGNFDPEELREQLEDLQQANEHLIDARSNFKKNLRTSITALRPISAFCECQKHLNDLLGGKIEYDVEKARWHFKQGDQIFSLGVMAEGIKKLAILDTLLSNGYLNENSIIFIDEPESALHPKAISDLLDIITILAKHGIQFFMASHSYFVIKKLFLIAQEQKMSTPVLSYQDNAWVQSDLKEGLPDNPIIDESIRLYEQEVDLAFK